MGHFAAAFERQLLSIEGILANRESSGLQSYYLCRPYPKFLPLTLPGRLAADAFSEKVLGWPRQADYAVELIYWDRSRFILSDPDLIQWTGLEDFVLGADNKISSSSGMGRVGRIEVRYDYKILEGARQPKWNDYTVSSGLNLHVWAFDELWVDPAGEEKTLETINLFVGDTRRPQKMQVFARFTDGRNLNVRSVAHQVTTSVAPGGLAGITVDTPVNFWDIPWLYVSGKEVGSGTLEIDAGLGKRAEINLKVFSFSSVAPEGVVDSDGNVEVEKTMGSEVEFQLQVEGPLLHNANDPDKTDDYRVVWSIESLGSAPYYFSEPTEESGPIFSEGKNVYSVSYQVPETASEIPLGYKVTGRFWEKDSLLREAHFGLTAVPREKPMNETPGGDPGGDPDGPPPDELGNLPAGHKLVFLVLLPPEVRLDEPAFIAAFPMVVPLDFPDPLPLTLVEFEQAGPELDPFFIRGEAGRFLEGFGAGWTLAPGVGIIHLAFAQRDHSTERLAGAY
jgi:hypothetical protein